MDTPNVRQSAKHKTWAIVVACLVSLCLMCFLTIGGKKAQAINVSASDFAITANIDRNNPDAPKDSEVDYCLYMVAKAEPLQGYDAFTLSATGSFADPLGAQINALNGAQSSSIDAGTFQALAQSAAQVVHSTAGIAPAVTKAVGSTASNLQAGLYLMVIIPAGSDAATIEGHGLEIADGKLVSYAYGATKRYTFEPQLITVPTKPGGNTASPGDWQGSNSDPLSVTLKYTEAPRTGSLEIIKDLPDLAVIEGVATGATFIFNIEGTRDGVVVFSDVQAIRFSEPGSNSVIIENIPIDLDITVTEVYSGTVYKPVGDESQHVVIIPTDGLDAGAQHATVTFANAYDHTNNRGGSVINSFSNGPEEWVVNQDPEVA